MIPLQPALLEFVSIAARSTEPVVLQGETGTGKTHLARLIHAASSRANGPFIDVNCATLSPTLVERELFGHTAGAFTDARTGQPGFFEAAHHGTLLLDEITELPLPAQSKLLSAVDEHRVRRLGSVVDTEVDVRLVAATNLDLQKERDAARFRQDLYYRLAALHCYLPPLRDRRDELPAIVDYLLRRAADDGHRLVLERGSMDVLLEHHWPGNVRELDHILRSAGAFDGGRVTANRLRALLRHRSRPPTGVTAPRPTHGGRPKPIGPADIQRALSQSGGNKTQSARLLGISRTTLWVRLKEMERNSQETMPKGRSGAFGQANDARWSRRPGHDPGREGPAAVSGGSNLASPAVMASGRPVRTAILRVAAREAWRSLRGRPATPAAVGLVGAIGVGLFTTIFAMADPFLLRPLPYPAEDRLVSIAVRYPRAPAASLAPSPTRVPTVADWALRRDLFEAIAAYRRADVERLRLPEGAATLQTAEVTDGFFAMLGWPALDIGPTASSGAVSRSIVLTHDGAAKLGFVGRREWIGRVLRTGSASLRMETTLPQEFVFPSPDRVFPVEAFVRVDGATVPVAVDGAVIGRLASGVTLAAAETALASTLPTGGPTVTVSRLRDVMTGRLRSLAAGAVGASVLLLLLCAATAGNFTLARTLGRYRELATRASLGATPFNLYSFIVFESLYAVAIGSALGILLATMIANIATQVMPTQYALLGSPVVSARAVTAAGIMGVVLAAGAALAAWVALPVRRGTATALLGERHAAKALRMTFTAAQAALAVLLMLGAALLGRSYAALVTQDTGLSGSSVLIDVSYAPHTFGDRLQSQIEDSIRGISASPFVESAGAVVGSLLNRMAFPGALWVGGGSIPVQHKRVSPSYFEAVDTRFLAGRAVSHPLEVVINEAAVREGHSVGLWNSTPAIGQPLDGGRRLVGIVANELDRGLDLPPTPAMYTLLDRAWADCTGSGCGFVSYAVRPTRGRTDEALRHAERIIRENDRDAAIVNLSTISERHSAGIREQTFAFLVMAVYAVGAVALALVGLAAMLRFIATRRRHDVAIFLALGAGRHRVLAALAAESVWAVAIGLAIGLLAGRWAAAVLEHLLFGVAPADWQSTMASAIAMVVLSAIVVLMTVKRSLEISPATALREE